MLSPRSVPQTPHVLHHTSVLIISLRHPRSQLHSITRRLSSHPRVSFCTQAAGFQAILPSARFIFGLKPPRAERVWECPETPSLCSRSIARTSISIISLRPRSPLDGYASKGEHDQCSRESSEASNKSAIYGTPHKKHGTGYPSQIHGNPSLEKPYERSLLSKGSKGRHVVGGPTAVTNLLKHTSFTELPSHRPEVNEQ